MCSGTDGPELSGEVAAAARRVTGVPAMLAKYPLADLPDDPSALPGKRAVTEPVQPNGKVSRMILTLNSRRYDAQVEELT